jgi:transcriptional regulator with XRE-family HTH domain
VSQKPVPLLAVVLRNLRVRAGWTQVRLEREACLSKGSVCRLEKGDQSVDRFLLGRLAKAMGIADGDVERAIAALEQLPIEPAVEALADLPSHDRQTIETVSSRFSRNVREKARHRIESKVRARRWRLDRAAAGVAWQRLRKMPSEDRKRLVAEVGAFHTWAVIERLCEESVRAAANDVEDARNLAQLARCAAATTTASEQWRNLLQGYATSFLANAYQVEGNLRNSQQLFSESDELLRRGAEVESVPWDRTRPLVLRAALQISLTQLDDALVCLERALAAARTPLSKARVLICRAAALKRKFLFREAMDALVEARQHALVSGDARLSWAICFNEASYLCETGDLVEAEARLRILSTSLEEPGGALNKLRLSWLKGKVAAAVGHLPQAATLLSEVWEAFAVRHLWFDAALAVFELASIELARGHTKEVKDLAAASAEVFMALTLSDELLAAIRLFWEAAHREAASAQVAQELLQDLRRAGRANAEAP